MTAQARLQQALWDFDPQGLASALAAGADPNAPDAEGVTPLARVYQGYPREQAQQQLTDHDARVGAEAPLQDQEVFQMLVDHGASWTPAIVTQLLAAHGERLGGCATPDDEEVAPLLTRVVAHLPTDPVVAQWALNALVDQMTTPSFRLPVAIGEAWADRLSQAALRRGAQWTPALMARMTPLWPEALQVQVRAIRRQEALRERPGAVLSHRRYRS